MNLNQCPECKIILKDDIQFCPNCNFNISLYKLTYFKILNQKLEEYNNNQYKEEHENYKVNNNVDISNDVGIPRCPTCGSTKLTKITTADKALNIALFGLYGNKRKYQWHCNTCNYNW